MDGRGDLDELVLPEEAQSVGSVSGKEQPEQEKWIPLDRNDEDDGRMLDSRLSRSAFYRSKLIGFKPYSACDSWR